MILSELMPHGPGAHSIPKPPKPRRFGKLAMGQNPNFVPPGNIPTPTKIGSKMGGAPTPKWDPKTVLTHSQMGFKALSFWPPRRISASSWRELAPAEFGGCGFEGIDQTWEQTESKSSRSQASERYGESAWTAFGMNTAF